MAKNKTQKAAEERAAKAAKQSSEQPKQEAAPAPVAAPAAPPQANKQTQTIEKLKEGWAAKGVNLDKLTIKDDGKFKLLIVDAGWPTIRLGSTGGVTVMELRSYTSAFDAALNGKKLFAKQNERDARKAAAVAPKAPAQQAVTA